MFKEMLRKLRNEKGYSMDELVKTYNKEFNGKMNKSTLSRYENGLQEPMYSTVANLAKLFGVSVDELIGETLLKKQEPAAQAGSGFTPEQIELIRLFQAASPEIRAAALAVLRSAEAADKARDGNKEGK